MANLDNRTLHHRTGAGVLGVCMERPQTGQPHYFPPGGEMVGLKCFPVGNDGAMALPRRRPWYERFLRWVLG